MEQMEKENSVNSIMSTAKNNLAIPISIVIAGALIAGGVYFGGSGKGVSNSPKIEPQTAPQEIGNPEAMRPVSASDHIRGNPNAPVIIVEYSDTECPFCKQFHKTMKQVMAEYGKDGKVAWVYRNFPLDTLHPKARNEAAALECAGELGGNDTFWAYTDRLYEITPSNNNLDPSELPKIAQYVGLDAGKFSTCLASERFAGRVENDVQDAQKTGGQGTPWSIIAAKNGKKYPLPGAQPYEAVKQLIELALSEK